MREVIAAMILMNAATSMLRAQPARGTTVFADDFSTVATYAEKWEQKGHAAGIKDGRLRMAGGEVWQRPEPLEEFYLSAELALVEDTSPTGDKSGWAGVDIDGTLFLLTGNGGAWYNAQPAAFKPLPVEEVEAARRRLLRAQGSQQATPPPASPPRSRRASAARATRR